MNLDETKVYVFVRQDLSLEQQIIQVGHATLHAGMEFVARSGYELGIPYLITVGMPDVKAMARVKEKLDENRVPHYVMFDTDVSREATAIATHPVRVSQCGIFDNYRLWNRANNQAQGV